MFNNVIKFRPIFVTGTGTDVGKTYITALLCKALKDYIEKNYPNNGDDASIKRSVGYYKAAISGADSIATSDAGYINNFANLNQELSSLTSYLYQEAVSPHLAQKHEGSEPIDFNTIKADFLKVSDHSQLTVLEGSGGIYCPLCWEHNSDLHDSAHSASALVSNIKLGCYTIVDFMRYLTSEHLASVVVVADAALGCINNVVMTLTSLNAEGFDLKDVVVIINNYDEHNAMHVDNVYMIEAMTNVPVVAKVARGALKLELDRNYIDRFLKRI